MWYQGARTTVQFCKVELSIKGPLLIQTQFLLTCSQADKQLANTDIVLAGEPAKGIPTLQLMHTVMSDDITKERQARASVLIDGRQLLQELRLSPSASKKCCRPCVSPQTQRKSVSRRHTKYQECLNMRVWHTSQTPRPKRLSSTSGTALQRSLQRMQVLKMSTPDHTVTLSFMGDRRQQGLKHAINIKGILSGKHDTKQHVAHGAKHQVSSRGTEQTHQGGSGTDPQVSKTVPQTPPPISVQEVGT